MKNEIISIGYCSGDLFLKNVNNERINFKFVTDFESDCSAFWNAYPNVLAKLSENRLDPNVAIKKFIDYVDGLDTKYDLRIISDNPSYDISFIKILLRNLVWNLMQNNHICQMKTQNIFINSIYR